MFQKIHNAIGVHRQAAFDKIEGAGHEPPLRTTYPRVYKAVEGDVARQNRQVVRHVKTPLAVARPTAASDVIGSNYAGDFNLLKVVSVSCRTTRALRFCPTDRNRPANPDNRADRPCRFR